MQNPQAGGGNQEAAVKQILQFVQQAFQQGAQPGEVAQALLSQEIPPQIVVQIFVQMGMPQDQATSAVQAATQGGAPQGQPQMQGQPMPAQGPEEQMMQAPQGQEAPPQEMMEPQMRMGGYYARGGGWNGTYSGNQGFANGGINPYMYNDPYTYMEMGGMIPRAQYGMDYGTPPRPRPENYPDYATYQAEDAGWVATYGDQAMDYTTTPYGQDLGYGNPNLTMVPDNLPVSTASLAPVSAPSPYVPNENTPDAMYNSGVTVQDWLASRGIPNSYAVRKDMANRAGIANYTGKPAQDAVLLDKLKVAEQTGQLSGGTPAASVAAGAPVAYANNKSNITSNTASRKALDSLGTKSAAVAANPNAYNIAPTDSIPTVSLDSIPSPDTTVIPIDTSYLDLSDNNGMPLDTSFEDFTSKQLDSILNLGPQITQKEKKILQDAHDNAIWKNIALASTPFALGYAWKGYKTFNKAVAATKKYTEKQIEQQNIKEGELLAEIDKKYKTPESIMERAKARGGWYTTEEKTILDAVTDKKLKAEIKKLKFNQNADSKSVLAADMAAEGWGPDNDFFSPENQQKIAAHVEDNLKQAEEIIKTAEARGYKTAADIKKLRQLMDSETIIQLTAGIPKNTKSRFNRFVDDRLDKFIDKGGDLIENFEQKISSKYSDLSARAGKIKTNLKGGIKKAFTPKYDFVPGAGLEGTNAWRTITQLGNAADIAMGGVEIEEAQYVLANKSKFPKKAVAAAEATLKQNNITPEFQNIVSAYIQQIGDSPASNSQIVDQYHADLESGVRTPLVEAVESGTGIASTKQRTGILGNTFEGMKKAKNAVGSKYDALTNTIKTGAKTAKDKAAFWSDAFAGKLGNFATSVGNAGTSVANIPAGLRNKLQQRSNRKVAAQIFNSTNPNLGGNPTVISQPVELSVEEFMKGANEPVTVVPKRTGRKPKITKIAPNEISKPIELSIEPREIPTESAGAKAIEMLRGLGKFIRRKEYGGPISEMDYGGYIPDYQMAYGGVPEAMYGMGMAYGGMYASGGQPCYDREGNPIPCPPEDSNNLYKRPNPYNSNNGYGQYPTSRRDVRMNPYKESIPDNNFTNFPHEQEHVLDGRYRQPINDPGFIMSPSVRPGYNPDPGFIKTPAPGYLKKKVGTNNGMLQQLGYAGGGEVVPCNTAGVTKTPQGCFCPEGTGYDRSQSACIAMKEYQASQTAQTEKDCEIYGQIFNPSTGQCECGPGKEVDPVKKICVTAGSLDKLKTPMNMNDIYSGRGNRGKGLWNAGFEVGKNDWNLGSTFSLDRNNSGGLGSPTFGLYGNSASLFGGRGGLNGALNYQSGNTFGGNLGASIPLSKKNPYSQLSVYGAYDQNLNPNASSADNMQDEDQSFMRTNPNTGGSRQNFSGGIGYNTVTPSGLKIKAGVTYNPNKQYGGRSYQAGGLVEGQEMDVTPEQLQMLKDGGYQFQIMH